MTNTREVKKSIKRLGQVKTWQLVILLIIASLLCATFLRLNNIGMVERRTAVLAADKRGDQTALINNLSALQRYSSTHMNAASGAVYLEGIYKIEVERRVTEARNSNTVDKDALAKADATCRAQFPGYSQAYVQCNASEQAKYQGSSSLQSLTFPNPELYRHDFASPVWSPDFAGFSLLICLLLTGVIIARAIALGILRLLLRQHYSSI